MTTSLYHEEYPPPWRPLLILVFPILPIFWLYRVDVTKPTLTFGYSHAYVDVSRDSILSATKIDYVNGLTSWGGWGIRFNLKGETGYIAKNGSAVRIEIRKNENERKIYVFNCDEPERVCRILNGDED